MQDEINELKNKILQLQIENNRKTSWISMLSHDFKEAFGNIIWLIQALENKIISEDDYFKLLPEIKQGAEKNLQSIVDTTDWIKTQFEGFNPTLKKIFLFSLYLNLKDRNTKKLNEKDITFQFKGNETLYITSDSILIHFVLNKILENAIKYSYCSSIIDFVVYDDGDLIKISIIDHGIGMNEETIKKIFTFESAKYSGTNGEIGAGLSLKIIKDFVILLTGKIEIVSEQEKCTIISIIIPKEQKK